MHVATELREDEKLAAPPSDTRIVGDSVPAVRGVERHRSCEERRLR